MNCIQTFSDACSDWTLLVGSEKGVQPLKNPIQFFPGMFSLRNPAAGPKVTWEKKAGKRCEYALARLLPYVGVGR